MSDITFAEGHARKEVEAILTIIETELRASISASIRLRAIGTCLSSEIEDIVAEVFLRFWCALLKGYFPDVTSTNCGHDVNLIQVRRWLFCTARNVRLEFFRQMRDAPQTNYEEWETPARTFTSGSVELYDYEEMIDDCPPMQRQVFLLKLEGWSFREIASQLRISESTVRGHYLRARTRLQRRVLRQC